MSQPLLICMTPVRNEAWVLHVFLKATSLWADHIIIADQESTDDSREIALSYPKVILIDNNSADFNEAERQRLLISKAREIEGDKILFGLDADEIFSANFSQTTDWQKILNSKQGDVFWFKWAELCPDKITYWESKVTYYPWMFHDDGVEPHGNYVRNMHSMRIPYPIEEKQMYYVNDFKILHLAYLDPERANAKRRFYKFIDWQFNCRSIISLSRSYAPQKKTDPIYVLPLNYLYSKPQFEFNLIAEVDLSFKRFWFDNYVYERINQYPIETIRRLDIWEEIFLKEFKMTDPRTIWNKLLHLYLKYTQKISQFYFIKLIDRLLKSIVVKL